MAPAAPLPPFSAAGAPVSPLPPGGLPGGPLEPDDKMDPIQMEMMLQQAMYDLMQRPIIPDPLVFACAALYLIIVMTLLIAGAFYFTNRRDCVSQRVSRQRLRNSIAGSFTSDLPRLVYHWKCARLSNAPPYQHRRKYPNGAEGFFARLDHESQKKTPPSPWIKRE
ncbi:uncharacterized protein LOC144118833 [Amblyomma americanum]